MTDTLLSFVSAMNGIPDNTSKLISPQDARQAWLSLVADRGAAFADSAAGPWVIPNPGVDIWVDIPLTIAADMVGSPASLFWRMDINGHLGYDYVADWPTTIVPPGYTRAASLLAVVGFDPNGDTGEFAFAIDGVIQEPVEVVETGQANDAVTVTVIAGQGIDVSVAPRVSVQMRNTSGGTNPLDLLSFSYRVTGGVLA